MKKRLCLLGISLILAQNLKAQNATEIIHQHLETTGGTTEWKKLNNVHMQGRLVLGVKQDFPVRILQQRPNLSKTLITQGTKEILTEGYNGKYGVQYNYLTQQTQKDPKYSPENFDSDLLDHQLKGFQARLINKTNISGQDVWQVQLSKGNEQSLYFFDTKTYYLLREIKGDTQIDYADFRKVGNLVMPYRIVSTSKSEGTYRLQFNKIETNKKLPTNTFQF